MIHVLNDYKQVNCTANAIKSLNSVT